MSETDAASARVRLFIDKHRAIRYNRYRKGDSMQTKVAVISIVVSEAEKVEQINRLLHDSAEYIIGRMGIPYPEKGVNLISVAIDAPEDGICALTRALEELEGVNAQAIFAKI